MAARVAVKALVLSGLGATLIGCGGETTAAPTQAPTQAPTKAPTQPPSPAPVWPNSVEAVWVNHFGAFADGSVDQIMKDYDDESLLAIFNDKCDGSSKAVDDSVQGYKEYKGIAPIRGFFTDLFARLKANDPTNGTTTQNISQLGPINDKDAPASVKTGSDMAANSVFLTWRTKDLIKPIDLATDTFTFRKVGAAYRIYKQNIVSSEPGEDCTTDPQYNKSELEKCTPENKVCAGWANHFGAFDKQSVEQILNDYTDASVVQVYDNAGADGNGTYSEYEGKTKIGDMFKKLFEAIGAEKKDLAVKILDVDETRKTVFLVWASDSHPKATDTFIFDDNGKILTQTIVVSTKGATLAAEMLI